MIRPPESRTIGIIQVICLAAVAAVMVSNIYYPQPLLSLLSQDFNRPISQVGIVVTLTQLGYGLSVLLIVPLGDVVDRRKLASLMLSVCAFSLAITATTTNFLSFCIMQLIIGMSASATMVIIPYVATYAPDDKRGGYVGKIVTGVLLGILLARTVSGSIAHFISWRAIYLGAAILVTCMLLAVRKIMLPEPTKEQAQYFNLIKSVITLITNNRVVRHRSFYALLGMGSFSAFWTALTLLLSAPPYNYDPARIGLFGLIGIGGALSAGIAGKLSDKGHSYSLGVVLSLALAASWLIMAGSTPTIAQLVIGVLILDVSAMGLQVIHQSVLYKSQAGAQSRITSAFITSGFVGMAIGSAGVNYAYTKFGWHGACIVGGGLPALMVVHIILSHSARLANANPARPNQ